MTEATMAVEERVSSTNGSIVPRNSDSLSLYSDDLCLDETDDDEAAPPVVAQPAIQPPAEEPSQETDASRSISTSSGVARFKNVPPSAVSIGDQEPQRMGTHGSGS